MSQAALILSGCGFLDGSEIHESVLCLLALKEAGFTVKCFAPNIPQKKVVNHLTKQESDETRNVLVESARIARCEVKDLKLLNVNDFDAILLPGGLGAALNLSSYASEEENCHVEASLKAALLGFHQQKKPIGATCIAPAVLAKVFEGKVKLHLTLGTAPGVGAAVEKMGMKVSPAGASEMIADDKNRVFTTPCYMEAPDLPAMYQGVKKVVAKLKEYI